jgi:hypothetical protein
MKFLIKRFLMRQYAHKMMSISRIFPMRVFYKRDNKRHIYVHSVSPKISH